MNVGMCGAGKLGFPVGVAIASRGHRIFFDDVNKDLIARYREGWVPPHERGMEFTLSKLATPPAFVDHTDELAQACDIIFVAVQTPHLREQDGSVRFHNVRADFDLTYVKSAITSLRHSLATLTGPQNPRLIVLISTMLPGSFDHEIAPLWPVGSPHKLIYSPSFIAMGTVIEDFLHPEFFLIGADDLPAAQELERFYRSLDPPFRTPVKIMSHASAELTKVAYNTTITMKITLANLVADIARRIPTCDGRVVCEALSGANRRLTSEAYMEPGMVDGGGCHPRDNIALSWLAEKLQLPYNLYDYMMEIREAQVEQLAEVVISHFNGPRTEVVILGREFKAGVPMTDGSPSVLLRNILAEFGVHATFWSKWDNEPPLAAHPRVYVVGACDGAYSQYPFEPDSVVIDPWGCVIAPEGVTVIDTAVYRSDRGTV